MRSEEIADLAKKYKARSEGLTGPLKMERLLSRHEDSIEESPTVVSIQSLALNDTRFRKLSKQAKRKSLVTDIFVVVVAVVLGIGVGYFVIKSLFPSLISSDQLLKDPVRIETTTADSKKAPKQESKP